MRNTQLERDLVATLHEYSVVLAAVNLGTTI